MLPLVYGIEGERLTPEERAFFRDANPVGYILFKRNCATKQQVRGLTDSLRDLHGRHVPILIDQEGGRVQRLRAPEFIETPALKTYIGQEEKLVEDQIKLAKQLHDLGITVNCTPVLDLVPPNTPTEAIGDRSFGSDPDEVALYGGHVCAAHLAQHVTPVIKHLPGHGRAKVDSHHALPVVDTPFDLLQETDFKAFKHVAHNHPKAWGMTTHIVFPEIDPERPATLSETAINKLIRGACGFENMLLTDDLFMGALNAYGNVPARVKQALEAGVDLALHCHGSVAEMALAANTCPSLRADTAKKLNDWMKQQP